MNIPLHRPELIQKTPDYLQTITSLAHPEHVLNKKGYLTAQLTSYDLERKKRCLHCSKVLKKKDKIHWAKSQAGQDASSGISRPVEILTVAEPEDAEGGASLETRAEGKAQGKGKPPKDLCRYHTGAVRAKHWTCCGGFVAVPGCVESAQHTPRVYAHNELELEWQLHPTPSPSPNMQGRRRGGRVPAIKPVDAVAIDCEMGTSEYGDTELIRLTIIDYFTGQVLLDKLVWPDCPMQHFNTRFSGITRQMMNDARRRRTCLFGRASARAEMWKFIGQDTVVVGHGSNNDFTSLRWIHPRIVDTFLIEEPFATVERAKFEAAMEKMEEEKKALKERGEPWDHLTPPPAVQGSSLKALTDTRLKRKIQMAGRGHDSLEDAWACRDLLHWHVVNRLDRQSLPAPTQVVVDEIAIAQRGHW
ncbi:ribonuclease H-like domain-containing protein [Emericellopsis atlantica]|uniref:Ribonuclease H-like domain-containing protein n=1 Tax=Emericellopsis atlantica TaxID=2614577 RepID=A0A9P7ZLS4_9HYPO|nr:ribonuclease H-like domain-containing protein [Emericellopsis atlantica]KAG9254047.1 ribonuclease H-like domain-containing protein [Emericellopsis atlantica]